MLIQPAELLHLRKKYPWFSEAEMAQKFKFIIHDMQWIVDAHYLQDGPFPATLYAAAILKMHAWMDKNQWRRADCLGGYYQLIDQYQKP